MIGGKYIVVPERGGLELHGSGNPNFAFLHIGTVCHEFGHTLGFYEEYNPGYQVEGSFTDCNCSDLGRYDLMAYGLYNGPLRRGECPATLSPLYRIAENWITPILLSRDTTNLVLKYNYDNPVL